MSNSEPIHRSTHAKIFHTGKRECVSKNHTTKQRIIRQEKKRRNKEQDQFFSEDENDYSFDSEIDSGI